ncbi:hypothetical protein AAY473_000887 [Plecturocebus cupreus]
MREGNSVQAIRADTSSGGAIVNQSTPASNTKSPGICARSPRKHSIGKDRDGMRLTVCKLRRQLIRGPARVNAETHPRAEKTKTNRAARAPESPGREFNGPPVPFNSRFRPRGHFTKPRRRRGPRCGAPPSAALPRRAGVRGGFAGSVTQNWLWCAFSLPQPSPDPASGERGGRAVVNPLVPRETPASVQAGCKRPPQSRTQAAGEPGGWGRSW